MIKQLPQKSIYFILILTVPLCYFTSCDEHESSPKSFLASIEAPENFLDSDDRLFLLASDNAGESITFAEVKNGKVTELNSDSFNDSTFTLSLISIVIDTYSSGIVYKSLWGNSYHDLKRGVKAMLSDILSKVDNHVTFTCQNFDATAAYEYSIASNSNSSYVNDYYFTGDLDFRKNSTRLFITKYGLDYKATGYSFPNTTYTSGATATINLSENYTAFQSEIVEVADATHMSVNVYGLPKANSFDEKYFVSRNSGDQSMILMYPGTLFPAYSSYSYLLGEDFYLQSYNKSQRSDFSLFDVEGTLTVTGQTLEYSVTGDGHIVFFDFKQRGENFESFDWNLHAPAESNQSVTIPMLPSEITADFTSFNYAEWKPKEEITAFKIETINSIDEFFHAKMDGAPFHSLNSKSMRLLNTESRAARESGMKAVTENPWEKEHDNYTGRFERD